MSVDDQEIDTADDEVKLKRQSRGRPRNKNYLPWEEARQMIRDEMLPSRGKYFEWWDRNKPKVIPRYPYRVYVDEWVSWNDFLGTDNKFNDKMGTKWRSFAEATGWAIKLGLQTQEEWMESCRRPGFLPADIPARPDIVYHEWRSWGHWLGNKPVEAIEARKEIIPRSHIFYIIHEQNAPGNVLTFGVEQGGHTALKARWEAERFDVVKLFWYDNAKADVVMNIVKSLSSPYLGDEQQRLVPNVWEIVWYLQLQLEMITKLP